MAVVIADLVDLVGFKYFFCSLFSDPLGQRSNISAHIINRVERLIRTDHRNELTTLIEYAI